MENSQNQNLEPNNFTQPEIPKQKRRVPTWLGFVIIIGFAIIVFGGIFAYQQFFIPKMKNETAGLPVQSQQATAGWKTYTSDFGFKFSYPSSIKYPGLSEKTNLFALWESSLDGTSIGGFSVQICRDADNYGCFRMPNILIGGADNRTQDIGSYINREKKYDNEDLIKNDITINGVKWTQVYYAQFAIEGRGTGSEEMYFYTNHNDRYYIIDCQNCGTLNKDFSYDSANEPEARVFSNVVSTFKFTK